MWTQRSQSAVAAGDVDLRQGGDQAVKSVVQMPDLTLATRPMVSMISTSADLVVMRLVSV
jgi:hypothetical protein